MTSRAKVLPERKPLLPRRRWRFAAFLILAISCPSLAAQDHVVGTPTSNRAPLAARPYFELPLGAIEPRGWLRDELERMAAGMTGHLGEWYPQVLGPRNGWLGGDGDAWERAVRLHDAAHQRVSLRRRPPALSGQTQQLHRGTETPARRSRNNFLCGLCHRGSNSTGEFRRIPSQRVRTYSQELPSRCRPASASLRRTNSAIPPSHDSPSDQHRRREVRLEED